MYGFRVGESSISGRWAQQSALHWQPLSTANTNTTGHGKQEISDGV